MTTAHEPPEPAGYAERSLARLTPWICAALHALALVAMGIVLRGGTEAEPDGAARARYIAEHAVLWRSGWALWMLSAASLVAFYAWWGSRVPGAGWGVVATVVAAAGMVFDLSAESLYVTLLVERAASWVSGGGTLEDFLALQRLCLLLTAGAANGLYTLGGIVLTLGSPGLPVGVRVAMWMTWLAGFTMSVSALLGNIWGIALSTAILFPIFVGWVCWMGWKWSGPVGRDA